MSQIVAENNARRAPVKVAVVIPTRHRASLAIAAVKSLLSQPGCDLQIFVSDNSTQAEQLDELASFCREVNDPRVVYMRPPQVLVQATHWDWALRQALERSDASHFTVHYDRKITLPGQLRFVVEAAARYPDLLVSFLTDTILSEASSAKLWRQRWNGRLYSVESAQAARMMAAGQVADMGQRWPMLSNCLVPREVFAPIQQEFGSICDSAAPDSSFGCRFLALFDRYLYLDRTIGILYSSQHSTGVGYLRDDKTGSFGDFVAIWGDRPWLDAAPVPGLNLGYNILFHEYALVLRRVGSSRLPPLNVAGCLNQLASCLPLIENPARRAEYRATLKEHGWRELALASGATPGVRRLLRPTRFYGIGARLFRRGQARLQSAAVALTVRYRLPGRRASGAVFASDAAALEYVSSFPARPSRNAAQPSALGMIPVRTAGGAKKSAGLDRGWI